MLKRQRHRIRILLTGVFCLAALLARAFAVTIGPGPLLGTDSAGNTYYEEFQDWTAADLRALDASGLDLANGQFAFSDGYDDSRDLTAFYTHADTAPSGNYYFRVDLGDLALGAENGNLDLYVAIATGSTTATQASWLPDFLDVQVDPSANWQLCVCVYDATNHNIYDGSYSSSAQAAHWSGVYYNATLDSVEFAVKKQALFNVGWDGLRPLKFTVASVKDGSNGGAGEITGGFGSTSDVADTFKDADRGYADGFINGYITSTDTAGRAKYASIAHANQSINRADDIRIHIFDPSTTQKTGFIRTLDTHEIFRVPLNMHLSGSLLVAANWASASAGSGDPSDGPAFLARIRRLIDAGQTPNPCSILGGVMAEQIMPYFEGPVNRASMQQFNEVAAGILGISATQMQVMHTPERVIRNTPTGLSPLTGLTFADIAASSYTATVLDEVTHYHWWFDAANTQWSGAGGNADAPAQHKLHKINGVYCFLINDREDQSKFANADGGMSLDTRYTLLDKARQADQAQITVVFDDWEALAGKSFNISSGQPEPNNNQLQYQNTIRWAANHPWIEIVNLKDVLARATNPANPQYDPAWVVDHGTPTNLTLQTYEYLKWSSEGSYDYWYYNQESGFPGNEQAFYNLIPIMAGAQGDYASRGYQSSIQSQPQLQRDVYAASYDGAKLPSNKILGDLNTSGTLLHDAWADLAAAPANPLRTLGEFMYTNMIYETAWHEEQGPITYNSHNYQNPFTQPDGSWDGVNNWALRLANHVRDVGYLAYAARWAQAVQLGTQTAATQALALDLDQDGQQEYVLRNNKVLAIFGRQGGRLLYAFHLHPLAGPICDIGAPCANPSAPGEEELGPYAYRRSALVDMNGDTYIDQDYIVTVGAPNARSLTLASTSGAAITKTVELPNDTARLEVDYTEAVSGDLYVRIGASPNNFDLMQTGRAHLSTLAIANDYYAVLNQAGNNGGVYVTLNAGAALNPTPLNAGFANRNLPLTEEIELHGNGAFAFWIAFEAAGVSTILSNFTAQ
jgi:hypothetical protein